MSRRSPALRKILGFSALALGLAGCAVTPTQPERGPAQDTAAAVTPPQLPVGDPRLRKIPCAQAFVEWHDQQGYPKLSELAQVPRIPMQCEDPNVYPAYPQQNGKQYHAYQWGQYDATRLTAEDEVCIIGQRSKNVRGERPCLQADVIEWGIISDVYRDSCGHMYRGYWEVLFAHRDETMGTLLSKGRTIYDDPKSRVAGQVIVGQTYPVPVSDFLFFGPVTAEDAQRAQGLESDALARTHRYDPKSFLFEPR